jgi:hypothetical protein
MTFGPNGTILTWDGSFYWTSPDVAMACGANIRYRFHCVGNPQTAFVLEGSCNGGSTWFTFIASAPFVCSPFDVKVTVTVPTLFGCGSCEGTTINAEVTV